MQRQQAVKLLQLVAWPALWDLRQRRLELLPRVLRCSSYSSCAQRTRCRHARKGFAEIPGADGTVTKSTARVRPSLARDSAHTTSFLSRSFNAHADHVWSPQRVAMTTTTNGVDNTSTAPTRDAWARTAGGTTISTIARSGDAWIRTATVSLFSFVLSFSARAIC